MAEFTPHSIATYNIELSKRPDEIVQNVSDLSNKVGIFCLQEVMEVPEQDFVLDRIGDTLGTKWQSQFYLGDTDDERGILGHGVAIAWNTSRYELESIQRIALPKMQKLSPAAKLLEYALGFAGEPVQRRAISAQFRDTHGES